MKNEKMCTVVGGNYAHEVFMNPNLDFIKSSQKVNCTF